MVKPELSDNLTVDFFSFQATNTVAVLLGNLYNYLQTQCAAETLTVHDRQFILAFKVEIFYIYSCKISVSSQILPSCFVAVGG